PSRPLLEPEALETTHAVEAQALATGRGVKVAFAADGLDVGNPDFIRADGSHVFVDYQDFTGEGPDAPTGGGEAFGDASTIAAQGRKVYDLAEYVNPAHPLPAGCTITVRGVAPGAQLIGMKTFGSDGLAWTSQIFQGLDYAVHHDHADVLNESLTGIRLPDSSADVLRRLNAQAVAEGVVVVVASGDAGALSGPGSPASDPAVIDAGGSTTLRLLKQTGSGGADFAGGWLSGDIASLSSAGFTEGGRTVDLVAPGYSGWAVCTPDFSRYGDCFSSAGLPSGVIRFGGTSMAAPTIAGAAALIIESYRATHGGRSPAPALVKQLLTGTADDLGQPGSLQGAGELNVLAAVQAARSVADANGTPAPIGHGLLVDPGQAEIAGPAGSSAERSFTVTNIGERPQTLRPHVRRLATTVSSKSGSVHITEASEPFTDANGAPRVAERVQFDVPARADTLQGFISWPTATGALVRLTLIDPHGRLAAHASPEGFVVSHGRVDVAHPAPGRWTALIFTRPDTLPDAIDYQFVTHRFSDVDAATPSRLRLAPGQSGTVRVRTTLPRDAGDTSRDLVLDSGHGSTVVPLVLRALVRLDGRDGTFRGDVVGGNGRIGAVPQKDMFEFDVPRGEDALGVTLGFDGDPVGTELRGYLVDPTGHALGAHSTSRIDSSYDLYDTNSLQTRVVSPRAGRWRFVVDVASVAGNRLSEPYAGRVTLDAPPVRSSGVPDSPRTVIRAGTSHTATLRVRNDGPAAEDLFLDPRLPERRSYRVISFTGDEDLQLPSGAAYLVPNETDAVDVGVEASAPVTADWGTSFGDPELETEAGAGVTGHYDAPTVTPGQWYVAPALAGPFSGPAAGTASTRLSVHTKAFDPDVTTSTNDLWQEVVDPEAPLDELLTVAPHGTGTMTVSFSPTGPPGRVVQGTIYVDDYDSWLGTADEVLAIPYAYTVGGRARAGNRRSAREVEVRRVSPRAGPPVPGPRPRPRPAPSRRSP
ncbi:MAG: hypothetical protein QOI80_717, partial [Solirubrobacteraceae bacterium]|nr:hypothetical protein [Solirubrobacteraceae bacterium]